MSGILHLRRAVRNLEAETGFASVFRAMVRRYGGTKIMSVYSLHSREVSRYAECYLPAKGMCSDITR